MKGRLVGDGSARFGGFRYSDTATLVVELEGDAAAAEIIDRRNAILKRVADNPGMAKTPLADGVGGNVARVKAEIESLVSEGCIVMTNGPHGAKLLWPKSKAPDDLFQGSGMGGNTTPGQAATVPFPSTTPYVVGVDEE